MDKLKELLVSGLVAYPQSFNQTDGLEVFMVKENHKDVLIVLGEKRLLFKGEDHAGGIPFVKAPLVHENADLLRKLFPFTKPVPVLRQKRSFGVGDRLGIACPGHIRVFKEYDAYPVFAQQSIRELNLTDRTYADVLDAATFAVFRDGYKGGFGADGDHLKKREEIEYALGLGFTMITLDCSEHIRNDVIQMSAREVKKASTIAKETKDRYLNKRFEIEGVEIIFDEETLMRAHLIYDKAINFATAIYKEYFLDKKANADFEVSIDETMTPTEPAQHFYVASELVHNGVKIDTMAPRFCGEFQKGVDYIGDIGQFEKEIAIHAKIARHFGYKLSIHSGSDKFSVFPLIGKYTNGNFHVKTAGTNWLEAMRTVASCDPALYREVHKYALSMFAEAKKYYHVTTDLSKIPDVDNLTDHELVDLLTQNDARQLIHITYGFILNAKGERGNYRFKDRLYRLWREQEDIYSEMLYRHIGKHLALLYSGFSQR